MASRSLLASLAKSVNALLKNKGGARSKQKKKKEEKKVGHISLRRVDVQPWPFSKTDKHLTLVGTLIKQFPPSVFGASAVQRLASEGFP